MIGPDGLGDAGKGSRRRPTNEAAYRENYDRIFRKMPAPVLLNDHEFNELVGYLRGTCLSLREAMVQLEFADRDEDDAGRRLDAELFLCETCSWWCEHDENNEGQCDDCSKEEGE